MAKEKVKRVYLIMVGDKKRTVQEIIKFDEHLEYKKKDHRNVSFKGVFNKQYGFNLAKIKGQLSWLRFKGKL